jgi:hypothetical protein
LPFSVFGPVLLRALRRLASICLNEVLSASRDNWLRFVFWASLADPPLALAVSGTDSGEGGRAFELRLVRSGRQRMALQPKRAGRDGRIDTSLNPPCGFIAAVMDLTVVTPAQWHSELVAHFSPERAVLREPQVMCIRRSAAANQARLIGHELDVLLVAKAAGLGMNQLALVDAPGTGCLPGGFLGSQLNRRRGLEPGLSRRQRRISEASCAFEGCQPGLKRVLQQPRVTVGQTILVA